MHLLYCSCNCLLLLLPLDESSSEIKWCYYVKEHSFLCTNHSSSHLYLYWPAVMFMETANKSQLDASFACSLKKFKMVHFLHASLELTFNIFSFLSQGLAYQLIDDVLDFTGTAASLGKGSLSDIRHVSHLSLMWYLIKCILLTILFVPFYLPPPLLV